MNTLRRPRVALLVLRAVRRPAFHSLAALLVWAALSSGQQCAAQLCVQLNGAMYSQNFNSLPTSGSSNTSSTIPIGFAFSESGSGNNVTFAANDGSSSTGNTYSYGANANADRAFGELNSDTLQSTLGACFVNNTGFVINSFSISYTGEEWRLGAADAVVDKLDFQFSTTATALNDGTLNDGKWTDVNSLDFSTPNNVGPVGAKNGNAAENRTTSSPIAIIPATPIPQGATFFIRWVPLNIAGANDGLAIDDFALTTNPTADFDLDGDVDGADFLRWQRGAGTHSGASISVGDANRDGAVDALDLTLWRGLFGLPPFASTAAATAVPEPKTLTALLTAASVASWLTRRSRPAPAAFRGH